MSSTREVAEQLTRNAFGTPADNPIHATAGRIITELTDAIELALRQREQEVLDLLCSKVVVEEGDTEFNEAFFEVKFLGRVFYGRGGRRETALRAANEYAQRFKEALMAAIRRTPQEGEQPR